MKKLILILFICIASSATAQQRVCPSCKGYKGFACTACYGNGGIYVPVSTPWGIQNQKIKCKACAGYGIIACKTCKGYGVIRSGNNPSFGSGRYDCERCSCRRYSPKSTFNSDCKNCYPNHPKSWHYSQK